MRWIVLLMVALAAARDVTDEEYAKFPRLYHLDDYSNCLAQTDGLYCMGTFEISPVKESDATYDLIKEYSQDPYNFNHSELHRGYCVSSRCPALATGDNVTLSFEQCVANWAGRRYLRTNLLKLTYCHTHAQEYSRNIQGIFEPMDISQKIFLYVIMVLVAMNIIGTTYDAVMSDDAKKNHLLMVWSLRGNWQRLTATYEDGDPRLSALSPVQGVRVLLMSLILLTHSGCIYDMLYVYNPRWVEEIARHPMLMLFLNGTPVVQLFVTLSTFLLAYNMLLFAKNNALSFKMMPLIVLKRVARITPLNLLVIGFAATWWVRINSGPMWPVMVGAESEICRAKFWTHALYVNNIVDPENICLVQTWFLAVDMQLYLVATVLTLVLAPRRRHALPILAALVVASSVLNGVLAYIFDWKSIMYFAYPNQLKTMYHGIPSFTYLYQSSWGSMPGCFIGLFCAFLHYELQEAGIKLTSYKWLKLPYALAFWVVIGWTLSGAYWRQYTDPWFTATYVAVERPLLSILGALIIMGMINGMEGWLKQVLGWRGWYAMGRMSLAVLLVHWCVNMSIAAARPQPIPVSFLNAGVDWIATGFLSYVIAIPLTIMVEMPVQRFINALVC